MAHLPEIVGDDVMAYLASFVDAQSLTEAAATCTSWCQTMNTEAVWKAKALRAIGRIQPATGHCWLAEYVAKPNYKQIALYHTDKSKKCRSCLTNVFPVTEPTYKDHVFGVGLCTECLPLFFVPVHNKWAWSLPLKDLYKCPEYRLGGDLAKLAKLRQTVHFIGDIRAQIAGRDVFEVVADGRRKRLKLAHEKVAKVVEEKDKKKKTANAKQSFYNRLKTQMKATFEPEHVALLFHSIKGDHPQTWRLNLSTFPAICQALVPYIPTKDVAGAIDMIRAQFPMPNIRTAITAIAGSCIRFSYGTYTAEHSAPRRSTFYFNKYGLAPVYIRCTCSSCNVEMRFGQLFDHVCTRHHGMYSARSFTNPEWVRGTIDT